jgi:hypothetical protein
MEKAEGTEPFVDETESDAGPGDVFALAAELRQVEKRIARLVFEQALTDTELTAMDGYYYLQRRNEYTHAERAAFVAMSHRNEEYKGKHAQSLRLERQIAEAQADRKELATCLIVELTDLLADLRDEDDPDGEEQDYWRATEQATERATACCHCPVEPGDPLFKQGHA